MKIYQSLIYRMVLAISLLFLTVSCGSPARFDTEITIPTEALAPTVADIPTKVSTSTRVIPPTQTQVPTPTAESISYIQCAEAPVGENVTCEITSSSCSYQSSAKGSPTFCNDAPYPNHNFTLVVWGEDWSHLDGQCLIVDGLVFLYKGTKEIEATNLSQVHTCP